MRLRLELIKFEGMRTLPAPEEVATSLVEERLKNALIRQIYLNRERGGQISLLLIHLIGTETERFAAEPVYAVRGKGLLKSKGVEGLREEAELEEFLRGDDGRNYVDETLSLVRRKIGQISESSER